ncbi:hypothetical protein J4760_03590 [Salinicoccus sp. ID82-1]|uniref:YozE SAM-like domain-containing protein n=1 Tax=Salinicoccus cyprini TaxID=2493691 RepID=A0A558AZB7_9STAP|nr:MULTISPECIES: YozE family protein [Salinicoccus]MCG1009133.1 hypothetical protein [Salinicoccus sp. ID82-1]TVT29577.1 hypothetical protein FO441_04655 [Salinicoccus cyprini]
MKNYSFYQYIKTRRGEASPTGRLAGFIMEDPMFPKYSGDYLEISEYLEENPYEDMPLSHYDSAFDDYQNWLAH